DRFRPAIYTLSLHDALPIFRPTLINEVGVRARGSIEVGRCPCWMSITHAIVGHMSHSFAPDLYKHMKLDSADECAALGILLAARSEEHTSELQSRFDLVCRL